MSKELSTKHKWIIAVAIFLSVVAIILSIITLCSVYPNKDLGFDYLGIIVGMFALLITILIGWQIFSMINFKEAQKEAQDISNKTLIEYEKSKLEIKKLVEDANSIYYYNTARLYWSTAQNSLSPRELRISSYERNTALAIRFCCKSKKFDTVNDFLQNALYKIKFNQTSNRKEPNPSYIIFLYRCIEEYKNKIEDSHIKSLSELYSKAPKNDYNETLFELLFEEDTKL